MASIGVEFKLKNLEINDKKVKLQIWDTAGQERYRSITTSYFRGANCIALVYDITDEHSFDNMVSWLEEISNHARENVLKIVVGNKCDLEEERKISSDKGKLFANKHHALFIETSAKTNDNISELFEMSAKDYIQKLEDTSQIYDNIEAKKKVNLNKSHNDEDMKSLKARKKNSLLINVDKDKGDGCCK